MLASARDMFVGVNVHSGELPPAATTAATERERKKTKKNKEKQRKSKIEEGDEERWKRLVEGKGG
jgi:hypothetical protein